MTVLLHSLGDFLASPFRPGHPLARSIFAVLLFKLVVIVLMKATVFSGARDVGADQAARQFTGPAVVRDRGTMP